VLADRLADAGLKLALPSEATRARLAAALPEGQPPLPFDAGALCNGLVAAEVGALLQAFTDDEAVGALVYLMTTQPQSEQVADEIVSLAGRAGKPVLLVLAASSVADPLRAKLRQSGFVWHDRLDDAVRVLRALTKRGAPRAAPAAVIPIMDPVAKLLADWPEGNLTAPQVRKLVAAAGVAIVEDAVVHDAEAAVAVAERFGWPVVAKALVSDLVHKSDHGGVRLDLRDGDAVRAAVTGFQVRFGAGLEAVLLQPQIAGVAELIVGTVWDDALGPFVLVGAGGVFAELHNDTVATQAPVAPATAAALLAGLRLWPVLQGARGRPPADLARAVDAIVAVGQLAAALGPRLAELDINPLILRTDGAVAVDIRASFGRTLHGEAA
jgi:acetyl-CoA synthetase (ADP-forming)